MLAPTEPTALSDAEDKKLLVLAKATRARTGAPQSAALRDLDGRTYAAAAIDLEALQVSAVAGCLSMAISSGAKGAEAVLVLGAGPVSQADLDAVAEFAGEATPVLAVTLA